MESASRKLSSSSLELSLYVTVFLLSLNGLRLARVVELPEDPVTLELNGGPDRLDSRSELSLEDYTENIYRARTPHRLVAQIVFLFQRHRVMTILMIFTGIYLFKSATSVLSNPRRIPPGGGNVRADCSPCRWSLDSYQ